MFLSLLSLVWVADPVADDGSGGKICGRFCACI